jgi:hypothetical protein
MLQLASGFAMRDPNTAANGNNGPLTLSSDSGGAL